MYIDYTQHWDSEYRPHRHTYSHICRLRNMLVIAQLIERSNNVGETVSRPPHALLRASSAPHTCHTSLWARRHPRRRLVRARGDRYDRCVQCKGRATTQVKLNVLSRASLQVQNGHLRDARCPQRGPVPPYRLGRPERSRPELPTAPKPKSGKSTSVVRRR